MGKNILLILGILVTVLFLDLPKVQAADSNIIINEVMANAPTPETDLEWVELYNTGGTAKDLNGWIFENKIIDDPEAIIEASGYLILARNKTAFSAQWPGVSAPIIQTTIVLSNTSDTITLKNTDSTYIETFNWTTDAGDNLSWERVEPTGSAWEKSLDIGGTPGEENSVSGLPPLVLPLAPTGVSPADFEIIPFVDQIVFQWQTADTTSQTFEFILSDTLDFSNIIIDEPDLISLEYEATNLTAGDYYWQVIAINVAGETSSPVYKFTLYNPVYSNAIIINELMPDPDGDEVQNEWIELYNNSADAVDLNGWKLKDLSGTTHTYTIFNVPTTIIEPFSFLIFHRVETGITLNNTEDGAALFQPNGNLLMQSPLFADGGEDLAWARDTDGDWEWTENATPGAVNDIYLTPEEEDVDEVEEEDVVVNSVPIEIKTGEFRDFNQKLVAVEGTIITTSGNTFYLDDGSGQAKIYLQDAKGIAKPPMHKGDIFAIVGIVNLYRNTWRILPQKQSDVELIKCIKDEDIDLENASANTAKSTSNSSTAGKSTAQARAPTIEPIVKQVKAAETINADAAAETESSKTAWWLQIAKVLVGLAVIFLILLIIKIRRFPKVKVIGGHFGEDET